MTKACNVFMLVPTAFVTMALQHSLSSGIVMAAGLLCLFGIFCVSIQIAGSSFFSTFLMGFIGIFMGITLNLQIALDDIAIFTILILPVHEHGRSFCLLLFSILQCLEIFTVEVFYFLD